MNIDDTNVGARLSEELYRHFKTLKEAVQAMGVKDGSYFTPYRNNTAPISLALQKKLEVLGLDVDYITGRKQRDVSVLLLEKNRKLRQKLNELQFRLVEMSKDISDLKGIIGRDPEL